MSGRRPPWLAEDERRWDHITVHERVITHPDLTIYDRGVYCVLAWHANAETGNSRPGQPTIGKEAGCSERQVRRAIAALEATRLIRVIREPGKPIVYRLLSPPREPVRLVASEPVSGSTPDCESAPTPAPQAALQSGPWTDRPATPDSQSTPPRTHSPQNNKESLNKNQEQEESTSRGPHEIGSEPLRLVDEMPQTPKPRRQRRTAETVIPEGFPTPLLVAEGKANHPNIDIDLQTARFVNWAKSKGITYRDWAAGYRNWLLGAEERVRTMPKWPSTNGNGNGHKPYSSADIATADQYAAAIAAAEASENGWGI